MRRKHHVDHRLHNAKLLGIWAGTTGSTDHAQIQTRMRCGPHDADMVAFLRRRMHPLVLAAWEDERLTLPGLWELAVFADPDEQLSQACLRNPSAREYIERQKDAG